MVIPEKASIITGDRKLDIEHNQIFSIVDNLQDTAMPQSLRIASCEKLLHNISEHCKDEEDLMRFHDYPGIEAHKEAHRHLQDNFLKSLSQFIRVGGIVNEEIRTMFYNHVINIDMPMIKYIQNRTKLIP